MDSFGKRLRKIREKVGYSQKDFAEKLSITKDLYNKYENDKHRPPFEIIDLICTELGITSDYLLRGIEPTVSNFEKKFNNLSPDLQKAIEYILATNEQAATKEKTS